MSPGGQKGFDGKLYTGLILFASTKEIVPGRPRISAKDFVLGTVL